MEKDTRSIRRCGIDEAGRGALAGPLVAAAVVMSHKTVKTVSRRAGFKVRDGKTLSGAKRRKIYAILKRMRATVAVEVISTRQINNRGINWANREIMRRLIKRMMADEYILDGKMKVGRVAGRPNIRSIVDADATIGEVILAGIVAKVERDRLMDALHREFPDFRWKQNKGYGTKSHLTALSTRGPCRYHRLIYVTTALRKFS